MWRSRGSGIQVAVLWCVLNFAMKTTVFFSDSAYTERYMGMPDPEDNWEGYQMADLTK